MYNNLNLKNIKSIDKRKEDSNEKWFRNIQLH